MDQNDVLDWAECREFVAAVMKPLGGYDAESFKETYDQMDKNADGLISKQELIEKVVEVGRAKGLFIDESAAKAPKQPERNQDSASQLKARKTSNKPEADVQVFRNGLSCLGKTFNNARHAYLKLNIQNKALSTINVSQNC